MSKLLSIDLLPLSPKAGVRVKGKNTSKRAASEMPAYPEHLKQILVPHSLPDDMALESHMVPVLLSIQISISGIITCLL